MLLAVCHITNVQLLSIVLLPLNTFMQWWLIKDDGVFILLLNQESKSGLSPDVVSFISSLCVYYFSTEHSRQLVKTRDEKVDFEWQNTNLAFV
jgi:hypothetical protein